MTTKTDKIRELAAAGFTSREIAEQTGICRKYVSRVRWRDKKPRYGAEWMAQYRANNPAAYHSDLDAQGARRRESAESAGRCVKTYRTKRMLARQSQAQQR